MTHDVNIKRLAQIIDFMDHTGGAYTELALRPHIKDGVPVVGIDNMKIRSNAGPKLQRAFVSMTTRVADAFNITLPYNRFYRLYRTSLEASIWRVETLKKLLVSGESPWEFEWDGSKRSEKIKEPFYLVTKTPVFQYFQAVSQRKYYKHAIEAINRLGFNFAPTAMPIWE